MSSTPSAARRVQILAEASDLPLRPEWLDELAVRWAFFCDGIERLVVLDSDVPATMVEPEDEE
jgi:hypothetical protein